MDSEKTSTTVIVDRTRAIVSLRPIENKRNIHYIDISYYINDSLIYTLCIILNVFNTFYVDYSINVSRLSLDSQYIIFILFFMYIQLNIHTRARDAPLRASTRIRTRVCMFIYLYIFIYV